MPPPRETRAERAAFAKVRNAEIAYVRALRAVARQVGVIVQPFVHLGADEPLPPLAAGMVAAQLERYADLLEPWASAVAQRMLADVRRRDEGVWRRWGQRIGRALLLEIEHAPIGYVLREALARQVGLITSLPRDAAERVHNLALTGYATGRRVGEIRGRAEKAPAGLAREILDTGLVTISRANNIARTETSRVAGDLLKARAEFVGSPGYFWWAVMDADTRPLHRKLNGTFHRWDEPPIAGENGERAHPGGIYQCRCFAEPVLPSLNTAVAA